MIFGEFTTKTGHIRVEILDGGDEEQVEISDIGSLKYEFDLVPDSPNVEAVQALYEKINIEIFQHGYSRTDLYDRLIENVKSQGGVRVDLYLDDDAFPFFIQLNDIELSEIERTISLECRVLFDDTTTVLQVFDEIPKNLIEKFVPDSEFAETEFLDATGVADWIAYAMREVFLNDFDSIVESSRNGLSQQYNQRNYTSFEGGIENRIGFLMAKMTSPPFNGLDRDEQGDENVQLGKGFIRSDPDDDTIWYGSFGIGGQAKFDEIQPQDIFVVFNAFPQDQDDLFVKYTVKEVVSETELHTVEPRSLRESTGEWGFIKVFTTDRVEAIEALQELAAIEGAIYGTGFGRNFFVNRILDQMVVDVPWDEITDMNPEPYWNPLRSSQVTQIARTITNTQDPEGSVNEGVDNFGVWPVSEGDWQLPLITDGTSSTPSRNNNGVEINLRLPPGYPFLNKARGQSSQNRYLGKYANPQWFNDFDPTLGLCRSGLRSLRKALSSDGDSLFIEFSCYESKRVKPWNLIRIVDGVNQDAPEKYKNRIFRSTSIEYDFVRDLATFEAYEILESDIPQPDFDTQVEGSSSSVGEVDVNRTVVIAVSGNSASEGEVAFGEVVEVEGESTSTGQVSFAIRAQVLTTPEGENLTTPEGVLLTSVLSSGIDVSGQSSSSGSVVISTAQGFQIGVSGESSSSGEVLNESYQGQPLTTPDGTLLTDESGNVLITPVLKDATASGQSSSSGQVSTTIVFTTEIDVSGESSSDGEIIASAIKTSTASGSSSSAGSVSTDVAQTKQATASGSSSSSGSVSTSVEPGGDPEPTNVSLILAGSFSNASWSEPSRGTPNNYQIQYQLNGGFWNTLANNVSGFSTSFSFDACAIASNNDSLVVRVRAVYTDVTSNWVNSNPDTVTECSTNGGGGGIGSPELE